MSTLVNGKKPLSQKQKTAPISMDDIFGNPLGLSADIKKACEERGLAWRFISYSKLAQMGGYHEMGWRPVTRKELGYDTIDSHSFQLGNEPQGLIRRGDLVLAVRPSELHEKHRAYLSQEAQRVGNVQKRHAQELKKSAAQGVKITEGYDEDNNE